MLPEAVSSLVESFKMMPSGIWNWDALPKWISTQVDGGHVFV